MQAIKLLSLCFFVVSSFSYGEEGIYMLVSGDLTTDQVFVIEKNTGYKAVGYFDRSQQKVVGGYSNEEDFGEMGDLPSRYGIGREETEMMKSLFQKVSSVRKGNINKLAGRNWSLAEKQTGFPNMTNFRNVQRIGGMQSLRQSIEEINARAREIHEEIEKNGIYAVTGELGFLQRYNFSESHDFWSILDTEERGTFFDEHEINEEEMEGIKAFHQRIYERTDQSMDIEEEKGIATLWGAYAIGKDTSQDEGVYIRFSEPIGGGGGGWSSLLKALESPKTLIQNHSNWSNLQPRHKALEWNTNNENSSMLFVLPSQDFGGAGGLDSW